MSHPAPVGAEPVRAMKVLALALAVSPVVVAVAATSAIGGLGDGPGTLTLAGVLLVVVMTMLAETAVLALATPPYEAGAAPDPEIRASESVMRFRTLAILRFALVEAPFIVTLALTFVLVDEGAWPVLVASVPTALAILLVTWPGRRNVQRVADRLERHGGRSYLPEALGLA